MLTMLEMGGSLSVCTCGVCGWRLNRICQPELSPQPRWHWLPVKSVFLRIQWGQNTCTHWTILTWLKQSLTYLLKLPVLSLDVKQKHTRGHDWSPTHQTGCGQPGRKDVWSTRVTFHLYGTGPITHQDARKSTTSLSAKRRLFPRLVRYSREKGTR